MNIKQIIKEEIKKIQKEQDGSVQQARDIVYDNDIRSFYQMYRSLGGEELSHIKDYIVEHFFSIYSKLIKTQIENGYVLSSLIKMPYMKNVQNDVSSFVQFLDHYYPLSYRNMKEGGLGEEDGYEVKINSPEDVVAGEVDSVFEQQKMSRSGPSTTIVGAPLRSDSLYEIYEWIKEQQK